MTPLMDWVVRPSVVLALTFAITVLLKSRSAALRHCVLTAAVVTAGVIAPLSSVVPTWNVTIPQTSDVATLSGSTTEAVTVVASHTRQSEVPTTAAILVVVWLIGLVFNLSRIAVSLVGLGLVAARAEPVEENRWRMALAAVSSRLQITRPVRLLESGDRHDLATWGLRRPCVVVPARASAWSDAWIQSLLCHELEHVRRGDWFVNLLTDVIRAVHWFNPFFWLACRRLRLESERACDDAVLRDGAMASEYASQLVAIARRSRLSSVLLRAAVPICRPSTLQRRIAAMLNPRLVHGSITRRAAAAVAIGLVAGALPIAAVQARQAGPHALDGVVYDATGAVVPDVSVTLKASSGSPQRVATDAEGGFEFKNVAAGGYTLEVSAAGFAPLSQKINLARDRDWTRAITLQVGAVQEEIVITDTRPDQLTPTKKTAGPTRVRVGGMIRPPTKTFDVRPIYPPALRDAGVEGVVPMEATIGLDGKVENLRMISAQVHPDLAKAAMTAVRQWLFTPTLLNGQPTEVVMTVTVAFKLEQK